MRDVSSRVALIPSMLCLTGVASTVSCPATGSYLASCAPGPNRRGMLVVVDLKVDT